MKLENESQYKSRLVRANRSNKEADGLSVDCKSKAIRVEITNLDQRATFIGVNRDF